MNRLVGRKKEIQQLQDLKKSHKSEFVAIYGRRRVGKTFLVRRVFDNQFAFHLTGLANVTMRQQLNQFHAEMVKFSPDETEVVPAEDWFSAFRHLIDLLEKQNGEGKKVVFLDELPWLDTPNSHFLTGLEHFWNSWASARDDILLIVCGSAASWMIQQLLNNTGGLHNRITSRMKLEPFSLKETEVFLQKQHAVYDRYQIVLLYMVFGGIPFYLEQIKPNLSVAQNIDVLCFERGAPFRTEYKSLYASLFKKSERHVAVVEALATKKKGLNRKELVKLSGLSNGGGLTRTLQELEESSFIRRYQAFGKKEKNSLYQLVDPYSLFYLNFIKGTSANDEYFWTNALESPLFRSWSGYAFEMVCLHHIREIKEALGIRGIQTSVSSWHSGDAQIDLVIDRKDRVINLCEMKFSIHPFSISKSYAEKLRNKLGRFREVTNTKKSLFLTLISTYGLSDNMHRGLVRNSLTMDDLFE